jgi:hypothetical protein
MKDTASSAKAFAAAWKTNMEAKFSAAKQVPQGPAGASKVAAALTGGSKKV